MSIKSALHAFCSQLILVDFFFQHIFGHQERETVGQHCLGNAQMIAEITEAARTVKRVSHDQQCPTLADDLQGPRDRAILVGILAGKGHASDITPCRFIHRTV